MSRAGPLAWLSAFALSLAILPTVARAQLSVTGSVDSDYRFRGLSLSNGRPVISLGVAYDHSSGVYAGVTALGQFVAGDGLHTLGFVEYAGYAFRPSVSGPSFDVGADNEKLDIYGARGRSVTYTEVYAGATFGNFSSHVYYSPDYFKSGASSIYASFDGAFRPADDWRLTAHGGVTTPAGPYVGLSQHERYDLRLGVSRQFRNLEAHAAWTGYFPAPSPSSPTSRPAFVFGASVFF